MNWSDIKHFKPHEFDSPDLAGSGETMMQLRFVERLDVAREMAKVPFVITSGYRTQRHNLKVGGSQLSKHMTGLAADISCKDSVTRGRIILALTRVGFRRLGIGRNYIHVDLGVYPSPSVWHYYKEPLSIRIAKAMRINTYVSRYYLLTGKDV